MISDDSFSRVSVTRPHGKVDTLKPRDLTARDASPDESPHSGLYSEGVDLPKASLAVGVTACSMEMRRSYDEGLEL
ncbi:hypothetical protein CDL15_Pgr021972 [Punica granatum]|uniref:Uncharacterized protein n=1 Tax=Punica granatum TaxID=22663 RepID=A0A218WXD5_PUNGR|nr:hypothetical protein CDL15_Pgr021972 [Punica granatum]